MRGRMLAGYPNRSNSSALSGFFRAEYGCISYVEVSALTHAGVAGTHARSPLLRLQSDERLIALIRRGNQHAFEALVARYQSRLLAFCRHMLSSREDAEDVLQEVFAAAFNAILADEREINVRPWLYRIARNRSLNHLRKAQAIGVDSMDVHLAEHGLTTADKVHKREEFRQLMSDVGDLPETQRTALLLREIDALSYEQISEAMETTVPSVKSLLVRARVSLAEAAEARLLTCDEVREELGEVAEGLRRTTAPVRRHLRTCERCQLFRKQLRQTNRALAAIFPVGPAAAAQEGARRPRGHRRRRERRRGRRGRRGCRSRRRGCRGRCRRRHAAGGRRRDGVQGDRRACRGGDRDRRRSRGQARQEPPAAARPRSPRPRRQRRRSPQPSPRRRSRSPPPRSPSPSPRPRSSSGPPPRSRPARRPSRPPRPARRRRRRRRPLPRPRPPRPPRRRRPRRPRRRRSPRPRRSPRTSSTRATPSRCRASPPPASSRRRRGSEPQPTATPTPARRRASRRRQP